MLRNIWVDASIAAVWMLSVSAADLPAAVSLPRAISSHMVLQRGMPVPIWGTADAGEHVKIDFRDQHRTAVADAHGKWSVALAPLALGDPATLTVSGASNTAIVTDVLVGEVWVGSGQSNMDTDVPDYLEHDPILREAAAKPHPNLRLFRSDVGGGWQTTSPEALGRFSAQLFYFGMRLQQELNVPVGVMEAAVRGSPSANWISDEVVQSDPGIQAAVADWEKYHPYAPQAQQYEQQMTKWRADIAALPPETPKGKRPGEPWNPPHGGETRGGRGDFYAKHIQPIQPFAIRGVLWDQGEGGTNIFGVDQHVVMHALIAQWRKDWGQGDFPWVYVQKPSGGGPALKPDDPVTRGAADVAPLPENPPQRYWDGTARADYVRIAAENPNTFMVPATDLMGGVHPPNKSGYGQRDTEVVLGAVYSKPLEFAGPTVKSWKVAGSTLRLTLSHVGKGLATPKNMPIQGFTIAGGDKHFFWADAKIEGKDVIVLSSPHVSQPAAARYAWAWSVEWANLFNRDGLPAPIYRTDSWWE